ncbi:helix-turn-helix transcriptional regulator [bacterium]|nr:helix-turn-helix transcriptional regulator [bacterium]
MDLDMRAIALLGLLMDGPQHGYGLRKLMDGVLSRIVPIKGGTLYYTLKSLHKEGLVAPMGEERSGRRPSRLLYHITPKGEKAFRQRALRLFQPEFRPYFPMHLPLYFHQHIPKKDLERAVRARKEGLTKYLDRFRRGGVVKETSRPLSWLGSHAKKIVGTTIRWLSEVEEDLS